MTSTAEIAKRYFGALAAHDLDGAAACWVPGGVGRIAGGPELVAPDGITGYFGELFAAFPDFSLEVLELTTGRSRTAVRWRARGTFAGPGRYQGLRPNGARAVIDGCDVITVEGGLIAHNDAYFDSADVARQLGVLPPVGSNAEARLTRLANARTGIVSRLHGAQVEPIADGVWLARGGFPVKTINVYLIEDDGGVTVFDAGIKEMGPALVAAGARLGGIKRVVLGHADADHRGAAPFLEAPVYCHPGERAAAESSVTFREYWTLDELRPPARFVLSRLLPAWDGGAVALAGTVAEGDEIAGFTVIDLPGHAPGQIGLFRESDRLALVSDCFYTLDIQTGFKGAPRVPHVAFNLDTDGARASIAKLAALGPSQAWAGHTDPVTGDVRSQLEQVAAAGA